MTLEDTAGIVALLESEYPQSFAKTTRAQKEAKVKLWAEMFVEDDAQLVLAAVKALLVSDREFAPSIGQIKSKMHDLATPDELPETAAWALVSKACANGLYGYQAEFEKLPPEVQSAVGNAAQLREWAMVDTDTLNTVVMSAFCRSYRAGLRRAKEHEMLPESVKALLAGVTENLKLTDGKEK